MESLHDDMELEGQTSYTSPKPNWLLVPSAEGAKVRTKYKV